jgi:hypothetical protein
MADFNLSAFDQKSNFHVLCTGIVMAKRDIESSARVGLTLKKLDANKPQYWMADYRFLCFPEFNSKQKDLIILSLIRQGLKPATIIARLKCTMSKIEDLTAQYESGLKLDSTMAKEHSENMKGEDFARVYGLH